MHAPDLRPARTNRRCRRSAQASCGLHVAGALHGATTLHRGGARGPRLSRCDAKRSMTRPVSPRSAMPKCRRLSRRAICQVLQNELARHRGRGREARASRSCWRCPATLPSLSTNTISSRAFYARAGCGVANPGAIIRRAMSMWPAIPMRSAPSGLQPGAVGKAGGQRGRAISSPAQRRARPGCAPKASARPNRWHRPTRRSRVAPPIAGWKSC